MATKAKESTIVGKEKKAPSSNSHTTTTKRTTKPSTTARRTTTNSTNNANSTPSEKNTPKYLKPTITSHLDSPSSKQPKCDSPNNKHSPIRRRSLDKPLSSSNLTKSTPRRSSIGPLNKSTDPSRPISDRTPKTQIDGKTKPIVTKSTKKTTPTSSTSTKKVLANKGHASINSTKRTPKEATKTLNVETEQVKEVTISQEVKVKKVDNEEHKVHLVEHVSDISPGVESEHEIEHVHGLEDSDSTCDQVDDERVISIVSEAEQELQEKKAKEEEHELEQQDETHQVEGGNNNESGHQENHHEVVDGKEDEGESGGGVIVVKDHKSENKYNEEEEKKKAVVKVQETKVEATTSKQQLEERRQRHKESLSNDVIEETTSKLLEERKNKVRALAGAFQTVIDHQTTSK